MKQIKIILVAIALLLTTQTYATVYEDAEDKSTSNWIVYDKNPVGATVDNVYVQDKETNAIEFIGEGTSNGYILGNWEGREGAWNNTTEHTLKWSMKFDDSYTVYVRVMTKEGGRYIQYSANNTDGGKIGNYIKLGLGSESNNGTWQDFSRNLASDLKKYEPYNELIAVNAFLVRGNGLVDDVELVTSKNHIDFVSAHQKDNNLILQMNGSFSEGSHSAFFIDTDNNTKTGYSSGSIQGADYLVENAELYKYPNSAIGWKWDEVSDEVKTTVTNTVITSIMLADLINTSNSMRMNASMSSKNWKEHIQYQSMKAFEILDYDEITFTESNKDIKNPERGIYEASSNIWDTNGGSFKWIAERGYTLTREELALNEFKSMPISNEFLEKTRSRFNKVREAGLKIILKVSYLQNMTDEDASLDVVLNHIEQLKPIYHEYADVIAVIQAGFIGAWGEWHSSSHELQRNNSAKDAIKKALLKAVPNNRMVQFRNPPEIIRWYPEILKTTQVFSGIEQSRIGFHNDCFIASVNDAGTFSTNSATRETQKEYMTKISPFVAVGGEICQIDYGTARDTRSCENALETASKFQYSYLSGKYHEPTINLFKKEGCWDELKNRLGYRFVLESAKIPSSVKAGDNFIAELKIKNDGFATPYNERPVYIVIQNGLQKELIKLNSDPRKWTAGQVTTVTVNAKLSNNLVAGNYKVSLWMPDASEKISNDPRYAIQTANVGTWNSDNGYNSIGDIDVP